MIPVALRLNNFLSYGTGAPVLDFEQFRVACLSGRNGQGKSALLDAMTWALWGEARKSSGSHKPDDQLLRIGARHMEVELTFDMEGARYRVVRTYSRSATGKTSKPGLELHLYDPDKDGFVPLTEASIRETQRRLNGLVGLDYDTFINSAFLLQGRSDEFTKKRPGERKEILSKILNLEKYERLSDQARERIRHYNEVIRQAEHDLRRLQEGLADADTWEEEKAAIAEALEATQKQLDAHRQSEQALAAKRAALEVHIRQYDATQESLAALDRRVGEDRREAQALQQKLEGASALLAQKDQIQTDFDRHEALRSVREELETKRELYRGLEQQWHLKQNERGKARNEYEKRLHALDFECRTDQKNLDTYQAELSEKSAIERLRDRARSARQALEGMAEVLQQRDQLQQDIDAVKTDLIKHEEALVAKHNTLLQQVRKEEEALPDLGMLEAECSRLAEQCEQYKALQADLDRIRQEGQTVAEGIRERTGKLSMVQEALALERERLQALVEVEEGPCPTCGTPLTPAHREEVLVQYREAMAAMEADHKATKAWIEQEEERREQLRNAYTDTHREVKALEGVEARRAKAESALKQAQQAAADLEAKRTQVQELSNQIATRSFAPALQARLAALGKARSALPFDEDAFKAQGQLAAQFDRYEDQYRRLEQLDGRCQQLQQQLAQKKAQAETLREQLQDGSLLKAIQAEVSHLEQQMSSVGFDPERLESVRRDLNRLAHAGARLKELLNAQHNKADWEAQQVRISDRLAEAAAQREELVQRKAEIERHLTGREALEATLHDQQEQRRAVEAQLNEHQVRLGQLTAWLEQCRKDRAAIKACRKTLKAAEGQKTLYGHLRTAFGKNGIPSLIIEQTLPEIEDRANELLDRLTDGRMHIRLETLADKKTGGTKETLEIQITDEQGTARPYETFSGGEGFRVNFALRIALAQLLAERSGVRVRTLVIDEGFGTQDAQGVQNMVEAIQAIQQDFDKIMIITHLDHLKEAFPVRIEVNKDPVDGSSFEVLGI